MAVGLARGDLEVAGQHGTGQGHNDLVAWPEVVRTADDAAHVFAAIGSGLPLGGDAHLAPVDCLAVRLRLGLNREHLTDDERAGEVEAANRLFLEADAHELCVHVLGGGCCGQRDELAEPAEWDPH